MALLVGCTNRRTDQEGEVVLITLYHFCCEKDMRGIRTDGITKGAVVGHHLINTGTWKERAQYDIIHGWQWLTYDGNHDRQSWATKKLIRYDRREYRFTVEIPEKEAGQLYDRDRLDEYIPGSAALFDGWDGSENWVVYRGSISKYQLKKLEHWTGSGWEEVKLR